MVAFAKLPLSQVFQIKCTCEHCGRNTVWRRDRIAREQLRRQVTTPEQLITKFLCQRCKDQGRSGRVVNIEILPLTHAGAADNIDRRPLSEIDSATATCSDCGHKQELDREALDALTAVKTVEELWLLAFCPPCRNAGSDRLNMLVEVFPPMPKQATPAKVAWSEKDVFTEDRSDPFPNLPRRFVAEGA